VGVKVGIVFRERADGAALRYRVARLRAFDPVLLAVRTPPQSAARSAAQGSPPSLPRKVRGKAWALYRRLNYPPRYYDLDGFVERARASLLPEAPALSSYPAYRVIEAPKLSSEETADAVRELGLDVLLPSGGIIRPVLLSAAPLGCLNVHHGWLPSIRGMWSAFHAIADDRPDWIGVTVHRMDAGIDTGPILRRGRPCLAPEDTHETLYVKLDVLAADLLDAVLRDLDAGRAEELPNPTAEGTYRSRPTLRQHWKVALSERRFFRRYGDPRCPSLARQRSHAA
jgi:folate-dependent phosphoribosylglycinamide formyltransferase PurN